MADISKLEQQANLLFNNVAGWEQSTLKRIGKRIGKYGKMSLADVKSINNIAVVKQDMDAITKELAKVTGYNISQIEQMYGELLEEQHLANQPLYDYRGKKFVPFAENRELQAIAQAYARTTAGNMVNLSQIGGSNLGFIDKNGKFKEIEKMYTEALDKAVIQVSTGATDFHTAMRDTIVEMGGSGIRINYADSGITRRLDTAVRQSLLWGAKQASVEYNEMIGQELGCDGIEIDYHSNPRPSHEIMQGKQYSIVGKKTINGVTYEDAYEQGVDGSGGLLNDYGCLHYKTPIILGISEPRYSEKELARLKEQDKKTYEIDGKQVTGYEATQMQRRLETAVRNEKSIKNMVQAEGNKKLVSDCNAKIKAYQTKYNEISEITGIQGDKKRMSVPKGTASVKSATPTQKKVVETMTKEEKLKKDWENLSAIENRTERVRKTNDLIGQELGTQSSFNGVVKYDDTIKFNGTANYDGSITLRTKASQKTEIHELLHQHSKGGNDKMSVYLYKNIEEGSVELLAQEICKSKGIKISDFDYSYSSYVDALKTINSASGKYTSDYDFAKALFGISLDGRKDFLKSLSDGVSKENMRFFRNALKTLGVK